MKRTGSQTAWRAAMDGVRIGRAKDKEHMDERRWSKKVGHGFLENARKQKWRGTGHSCLVSVNPGEGYFVGLSPTRYSLHYVHKVSSEGRVRFGVWSLVDETSRKVQWHYVDPTVHTRDRHTRREGAFMQGCHVVEQGGLSVAHVVLTC